MSGRKRAGIKKMPRAPHIDRFAGQPRTSDLPLTSSRLATKEATPLHYYLGRRVRGSAAVITALRSMIGIEVICSGGEGDEEELVLPLMTRRSTKVTDKTASEVLSRLQDRPHLATVGRAVVIASKQIHITQRIRSTEHACRMPYVSYLQLIDTPQYDADAYYRERRATQKALCLDVEKNPYVMRVAEADAEASASDVVEVLGDYGLLDAKLTLRAVEVCSVDAKRAQ